MKMFVQLAPEYLSYFKKDFHPLSHDYSTIVEVWKTRLANEYQLESFQQELKPILLN